MAVGIFIFKLRFNLLLGTGREMLRNLPVQFLSFIIRQILTTIFCDCLFFPTKISFSCRQLTRSTISRLNVTCPFCRFTADHCVHFRLFPLGWIWERARVCIYSSGYLSHESSLLSAKFSVT